MTIVESIKCVLQQNNDGLTSKQIYDEIIRQGLYSFGAENPVGVVNAQLRRRCIGLDFPTAYPIKFFEIAGYEGKKIKFRLISTENTATIITAPKTTDISELLPEEKIKAALQEHLQNIRQQVFDSVLNNSPEFFEHLVVDLLLKMGYGYDKNSGIVTGKPHDGGIDGIISEDKLGLDLISRLNVLLMAIRLPGMIYRPLLAPWNILTKVFLLQHRLLRDLQYNSSRSNSKKISN